MKTDYLDFIKTLTQSKDKDPAKTEAQSRVLIKKFFSSPISQGFGLLNPTYQSRVDKKAWVEEAEEFDKEFDVKYKIRKVVVKSGCLVVVKGLLKLTSGENSRITERSIQLMRESGPYKPDPEAGLSISGLTIPPFLVPSK